MDKDYWKQKRLEDFTDEEWEAVCMRCGKCCLLKSDDKGAVLFWNRICDGFDLRTCRCCRYETRLCEDCVKVDMDLLENHRELLPETCAYRLLYEGKSLPEYHPLVSGAPDSVHLAGQTVAEIKGIVSDKDINLVLQRVLYIAHLERWSKEHIAAEEDKVLMLFQPRVAFKCAKPKNNG